MAHFLKKLVLIALVLCSVRAVVAQGPGLAADDTAAYINTTLHKYPSLEFVASGCPGYEQTLTISEDRRSLIIKQSFYTSIDGGKCGDVQTLTFPIFSVNLDGLGAWSKQGQHSLFRVDCTNRTDCFSRRYDADPTASAKNANQWFLRITAPDPISDGLEKAIQHLVASLLTEANGRIDNADAFAKRPDAQPPATKAK